jgi:hypothetical protein
MVMQTGESLVARLYQPLAVRTVTLSALDFLVSINYCAHHDPQIVA